MDESREQVGDVRSWYFAPIFLSMTVLFLVTALTVILLYWNFYQKKQGKFSFENEKMQNLKIVKYLDEIHQKGTTILDHWGKKQNG